MSFSTSESASLRVELTPLKIGRVTAPAAAAEAAPLARTRSAHDLGGAGADSGMGSSVTGCSSATTCEVAEGRRASLAGPEDLEAVETTESRCDRLAVVGL